MPLLSSMKNNPVLRHHQVTLTHPLAPDRIVVHYESIPFDRTFRKVLRPLIDVGQSSNVSDCPQDGNAHSLKSERGTA